MAGRMRWLLVLNGSFSLRQDPRFCGAGSRPERGAALASVPTPPTPPPPHTHPHKHTSPAAWARAVGLLPTVLRLGLQSTAGSQAGGGGEAGLRNNNNSAESKTPSLSQQR